MLEIQKSQNVDINVKTTNQTEEESMCQGSRRRKKRYFPHRMTQRYNSVICQPHSQCAWLMDWEDMRDTSSGNPSVICSRHYQTYFQRAG